MTEIRKNIELFLETLSRKIYRHRWLTLILFVAFTAVMAVPVPRIIFDTSTEGFLHHGDPTLLEYNDFRHQFGRDELLIISIRPPDVFSLDFLKKLKAFHEALESRTPHLDEITSMVNARNTRGEADRLIVGELLDDWPKDRADLEKLKERVLANPLYVDRLISRDGRVTTVVLVTNSYSSLGGSGGQGEEWKSAEEEWSELPQEEPSAQEAPDQAPPFLTDRENTEVIQAVIEVMSEFQSDDFVLHLAGSAAVTHLIKRSMLHDMSIFVRLVILTIGLCLFIMFRRLAGVVFPLLIVAFSLIATLGLMSLTNTPIKLPTTILPSLLLAVGVGAAVHVMSMFYHRFEDTGQKEEAIAYALGHSGLAIIMTGLTTAAGLASFATAEVAPLADLGIFASIGVLISLLFTIFLLPALLAILPIKPKPVNNPNRRQPRLDGVLRWFADFSTGHAKPIVAVTLVLIIVSVFLASKLVFTHNILIWLPEDSMVRIGTKQIDHDLRGSVVMEVLIDTGRVNGLYDPDVLNRLDDLSRRIEGIERGNLFVGKVSSLIDILKEIHRALNENRPDYYAIPQDPRLIPQEFLLFENSGSDDLEEVVDTQFRTARVSIKVPMIDAIKYVRFLDQVEDMFKETFQGRAKIRVTGIIALLGRTVHAAIHSAAKSYVIAGGVITVMMIMLIGSLRLGLVSMIPNLLPICLTLGVMSLFNFPFDLFTMLIGSIAIGLAVDDTVHFMHNFRRYFAETGDVREAVRLTLHTAGRAMLVTSVVLSLGFFIYTFASMNNLFYFGLLTGLTIILALAADFLVAPAIMALFARFLHS